MQETAVSDITAPGLNATTVKAFTFANLVKDLVVGRDVIVDTITVDFMNATVAVNPGASASITGHFDLTATHDRVVPWRGLNNTTKTRFTVRNTDPGTRIPLDVGTAGNLLGVELCSLKPADFQLLITVTFSVLPDQSLSLI